MPRSIQGDVLWVGAVDWDRRLFDSLIPLPDGTSYNAYLVRGTRETALLDTVDPAMSDVLLASSSTQVGEDRLHRRPPRRAGPLRLASRRLLERYPEATVLATPKGKGMLVEHLRRSPPERIRAVEDGERIDLGGRTLRVPPHPLGPLAGDDVHLPRRRRGSSSPATSSARTWPRPSSSSPTRRGCYEAAKRYYAEIMMPFRTAIRKNLEKIAAA